MSAEEWNTRYPVGTQVLAFPGTREGRVLLTRTRSEAWAVASGTPVVSVEGYAGGIALTHIEIPEVIA